MLTNTANTPNIKPSVPSAPAAQGPLSGLRGLVVGLVFLLTILAVLVFIGAKTGRGTSKPPVPPIAPEASGTLSTPLPIAAVSDEADKGVLRVYFTKASPNNFKEELLAVVPAEAAGSYNKFTAATGEAKLEAGRIFFVYLNNPAIDRSDPGALGFLADVRADLEKTLGQVLF